MHGHQVKHTWRLLFDGAGPASAKNRTLSPDDLGLNKEIAERRMQCVRGGRRQDYFRITRYVDLSAPASAVGDSDSTQLDIILGRNNDLCVGVKVVVPAAKLGSPFRENRLKVFRSFKGRLICR